MSDSGAILSAHELAKGYDNGSSRLEVFRDVSFTMNRNEVVAISGESGSGKSTLLNILGGLDRPDGGTVRVGGKDIAELTQEELCSFRGTTVGFVFQLHHLLKDFTAVENVCIPALMKGEKRTRAAEKAHYLLGKVGLKERVTHYPYQLSGGERQRVAVARALINDPDIVLADEPTGNLDESSSRTVEELLFSVIAEDGNALLIVTHDPRIAANAATRYTLKNGTLGLTE